MAKVTFDKGFKGIRGKVGNMIFRQLPDGSTVMSRAPKTEKLDFSKKQRKHQKRFQKATSYARQAAQDQPIYAELAAATTMKTAYNFALSDWWHAPVIHRIERQDGRILVEATDNVMVANVQVTILDEKRKVMQKGEAARSDGDWWEFASTATGRTILIEAYDLPGHVTKLVVE